MEPATAEPVRWPRLYRAPSPRARVLGPCDIVWTGHEGERVVDPRAPYVTWVGGPRGGAHLDAEQAARLWEPYGTANGGDVAQCPANQALRACSLEEIRVAHANMEKVHGVPWGYQDWDTAEPPPEWDAVPPKDPSWKDPVEEAGGDVDKMRDITWTDVEQWRHRATSDEVYCSPPEKFGVRHVIMDLLTAPWIFPFVSRIIPHTPSARKLYYRALEPRFAMVLPGMGGRTLDKAQFFEFVFQVLLPAFPDFSFNARFVTTTGLDDNAHVEVQATGTHTGAPFSLMGLPPLPPTGRRIALPLEYLRFTVDDMRVTRIKSDSADDPQAFPTGIYLQLGGQLPGY